MISVNEEADNGLLPHLQNLQGMEMTQSEVNHNEKSTRRIAYVLHIYERKKYKKFI